MRGNKKKRSQSEWRKLHDIFIVLRYSGKVLKASYVNLVSGIPLYLKHVQNNKTFNVTSWIDSAWTRNKDSGRPM